MKPFLSVILLASLGVVGCSSFEEKTNALGATQEETLARIEKLRPTKPPLSVADSTGSRQKVDGSWVTNATSPVTINKRPPAFDIPISVKTTKSKSVSEVASMILLVTGMPVTLAPDVYRGPQLQGIANYEGTTEDVLKKLAGINRLSMRLENGGVTLYRYESAILRVKRKPGDLNLTTKMGVTASSAATSTSSTSNGDMSASIAGQSKFDPWAELSAKVKSVLTPEGRAEAAPATGSIIVTDVPEAVALARKIIDDDNKLATTAITVKVEVINVANNDDQNLGINWNGVFAELEKGNPLAGVTFAGPGSLATGSVGSFKVNIPAGSTSRFANSDFLIQALNKVGKAQTLLRRDFTTLNNIPSGFARTNSQSFRAKTSAAPASSVGGGGGQVGVEPGQITTGTRFFVTPTYLGDGEYSVELNYDDSFLRELSKLGSGQQEIDAPNVDSNQTFNIATLKFGETTILNAFELDTNKAANQGLTASTTSQTSSATSKTRIIMLVTVTGGPQ